MSRTEVLRRALECVYSGATEREAEALADALADAGLMLVPIELMQRLRSAHAYDLVDGASVDALVALLPAGPVTTGSAS